MGADPNLSFAIGSRVRDLRLKRQWRQIDLAEHSGVHEIHISEIERGSREPRISTLAKLAAALGSSLSEVLSGL